MKNLVALLIAVFLSLNACAQIKTVKWKEEVKLTNRQMIVLERSQDYRSVYSGGTLKRGWIRIYERMRTTFPSNRALTWEGTFHPIALDMAVNGDIYLVGVTAEPTGRVVHVGLRYSHEDDKWQRIPITSVPSEFHPNLLVSTHTLFIEQESKVDFVGIALKEKVDSDPRINAVFRKWATK